MKNYRWMAACGLLIFLGLLLDLPRDIASGQSETPPYKDPSLPIEKRVDDLVSRMTLAEKVSQMMNAALRGVDCRTSAINSRPSPASPKQ